MSNSDNITNNNDSNGILNESEPSQKPQTIRYIVDFNGGRFASSIRFYIAHLIHKSLERTDSVKSPSGPSGDSSGDPSEDPSGDPSEDPSGDSSGYSSGEPSTDTSRFVESKLVFIGQERFVTENDKQITLDPKRVDRKIRLGVSQVRTKGNHNKLYFKLPTNVNDTKTMFEYNGHRISIYIISKGSEPHEGTSGNIEFYYDIYIDIDNFPGSFDLFKAICDKAKRFFEINILRRNNNDKKITCYIYDDGYWETLKKITKRKIGTIHLPEGTVENVVKQVKTFLDPKTKELYQRLGVPYKKNFLFEGYPGTGKTSLIYGIASKFSLNVAILCFDPKMTDVTFMKALRGLEDNTILILEDIDALFKARKQNDEYKNSISFSGLLNALDGISHKEGLITIMTTNYKMNLDPALIRPGRIDFSVNFTYAIKSQIIQIFTKFFPTLDAQVFYKALKKTRAKVTTAMLQQFLFGHIQDENPIEFMSELVQTAGEHDYEKNTATLYM